MRNKLVKYVFTEGFDLLQVLISADRSILYYHAIFWDYMVVQNTIFDQKRLKEEEIKFSKFFVQEV